MKLFNIQLTSRFHFVYAWGIASLSWLFALSICWHCRTWSGLTSMFTWNNTFSGWVICLFMSSTIYIFHNGITMLFSADNKCFHSMLFWKLFLCSPSSYWTHYVVRLVLISWSSCLRLLILRLQTFATMPESHFFLMNNTVFTSKKICVFIHN